MESEGETAVVELRLPDKAWGLRDCCEPTNAPAMPPPPPPPGLVVDDLGLTRVEDADKLPLCCCVALAFDMATPPGDDDVAVLTTSPCSFEVVPGELVVSSDCVQPMFAFFFGLGVLSRCVSVFFRFRGRVCCTLDL